MVASERTSYTIASRATYTLTEEQWSQFLELLQDGYNVTSASRKLGFHRQTVYDRIHRDPVFAQAVKDHSEAGIDSMEDHMRRKAIEPGGFLANIAWLKAHRRAKWGDQATIDVSVHGTINVYNVATALAKLEQEREAAIQGECMVIGIEEPQGVREGAESEDKGRSYDGNDST